MRRQSSERCASRGLTVDKPQICADGERNALGNDDVERVWGDLEAHGKVAE